ncbi:MAG TPA: isocitrate lyase/phosphoenolpyruvate mutase family protein [Gammaproteobacteria bacterium]|nr:isocitrate lyase/phosphoenolpyruvate mutase family protein [Gammaproteobacteria bacterium]HIL98010.1 isocitrate lyase/phosphoenolpyruvate mutase family protein [Pseudomonadales bacterium]
MTEQQATQEIPSQREKCQQFEKLHQAAGAFLIPNPWDAGSARILQGLGFQALATTSAGLAYTFGRTDGEVTLEEKLAHCADLAAITRIPINVDFENGFADQPADVASNVLKLVATGAAGCSVEDFSRDSHHLYDFNLAVERVQAAAEAVNDLDIPFQLTARAENLLRGVNDIDDTINRLKAFEAAGANVLYAPGINSLDQLRMVTSELDRPFNVLAPFFRGATVEQFTEAGAQRISVGAALNSAAINPLLVAGKEMLAQGTFNWMSTMAPGGEVNKLLKDQ